MKIIVLGIVQRKDNIMTLQEILDRIEEIKSSLENVDDPHGIEGAVDELFILKDDIELQGIEGVS